jgi:hypothetical protein
MACPQGTIRYDIFFRTFPDQNTHVVKVDELLTFCLTINGGKITGTVNSITDVTGTHQLVISGVERITLSFRWGRTKIFAEGFIFLSASGLSKVLVEFSALRPDGVAPQQDAQAKASAIALLPPDEGDTGTGTGQQTR